MELPAYMPDMKRVPQPPEPHKSRAEEFEIDLDRVVYDPAYRQWVMDQLKRRNASDRQ
jgi:hypothetical protein